jgi:hypothetical protein
LQPTTPRRGRPLRSAWPNETWEWFEGLPVVATQEEEGEAETKGDADGDRERGAKPSTGGGRRVDEPPRAALLGEGEWPARAGRGSGRLVCGLLGTAAHFPLSKPIKLTHTTAQLLLPTDSGCPYNGPSTRKGLFLGYTQSYPLFCTLYNDI